MQASVLLALCLLPASAYVGPTWRASKLASKVPRSATTIEPPTKAGPKAPVFTDVCEQTGITLSRFMIETALANPDIAELESIMSGIETASKTISNLVRRSALTGLTGYLDSGNINVQGEEQKKLDVVSNDVLKNALQFTGKLGVVASEEEDRPVLVEEAFNSRCAALPLPPAHTTASPRECMSLSQRTPPRALAGLGADTSPCSTRSTARPTSTQPSRLVPFLASSTA